MNRALSPSLFLLFGVAAASSGALAQPTVLLDAKPRAPLFSVAELEQFLGGRTLVTLDLKDATMEQVAAALSRSSGQKIEMRPVAPPRIPPRVVEGAAPVAPPLYDFSTSKTPFWEALRNWQLAAREASETAAETVTETAPPLRSAPEIVPNSLGLTKSATGWWLQSDTSLADGRMVAAWPFLLIATDLKRNQDASLTQTGLRDAARSAKPTAAMAAAATGTVAKPLPQMPTPEIERWSDRLTLSGQVLIDPKLNPSALRYEVLEAKDDKGNDLRYAGEFALRSLSSSRSGSTNDIFSRLEFPIAPDISFQIPLRSKPAMGKKLVKLRGVLHFNVVTRSQHWETTQLDKPIGGDIFQNGGGFGVQFKNLEQNGTTGWKVNLSAESRGTQLEQMWKNRPTTKSNFDMRNGIADVSSRDKNFALSIGFSTDGANASGGSSEWGNVLNFDGVPKASLVDENGRCFDFSTNIYIVSVRRINPGAAPTTLASPDVSPMPADVAQNWVYNEDRYIVFSEPWDSAAGGRVKMGRPVKLILDLPLERREVAIPFEFTDLPLPPS